MSTLDWIVIVVYAVGIVSLALWVSRRKGGKEKTSQDYFLAGNTLTWWAIGTSLIASNISAEQIIGMTGDGYTMGLAIASYEWMAAITLIVIAKWLLPVYLEKKIYTMPQFLEMRYDGRVRTILAVFWLLVYVFVNLTSILFMGALTMKEIMGFSLWQGVLILAAFSALYSLYGGLMAVAWTDVVQVTVLTIGGIITTVIVLNQVSGGQGVFEGMGILYNEMPDKFDMIFSRTSPFYDKLPGLTVLLGGMWIANLFYWGFNQYITQRALAAKSLDEAQRGMMFAGYLKILMPFIVVVPGIAAFYLNKDLPHVNRAYPWLLDTFLPDGIKGLAFVALAAAIVSSLSSMINSTSTIFTMDIYRKQFNPNASESRLVAIGRITAAVALIIALPIAPYLEKLDSAFQFIQEFTGFVSPGVLAIFLVGMFYKKATANSAIWAAILTLPLAGFLKLIGEGLKGAEGYVMEPWLATPIPFLDRMGIMFIILAGLMVLMSAMERKGEADPKAISINKGIFHTGNVFNIGAIGIAAILVVLYALFW